MGASAPQRLALFPYLIGTPCGLPDNSPQKLSPLSACPGRVYGVSSETLCEPLCWTLGQTGPGTLRRDERRFGYFGHPGCLNCHMRNVLGFRRKVLKS